MICAAWIVIKKLFSAMYYGLFQNVDGLHTKAGSAPLTELHGTNWTVKCIRCQKHQEHRDDFQVRTEEDSVGQ